MLQMDGLQPAVSHGLMHRCAVFADIAARVQEGMVDCADRYLARMIGIDPIAIPSSFAIEASGSANGRTSLNFMCQPLSDIGGNLRLPGLCLPTKMRVARPLPPHAWHVNRGSMSDSRTSSPHRSPPIAIQWLQR